MTLRGLWTLPVILFNYVKCPFCSDHYFVFLWHSYIELCNDLLRYSGDIYHVIVRATGSPCWQAGFLIFLLWHMLLHGVPHAFPICLRCLWLLVLSVLTQCSCEWLLWWGELREERPPRGSALALFSFAVLLSLGCMAVQLNSAGPSTPPHLPPLTTETQLFTLTLSVCPLYPLTWRLTADRFSLYSLCTDPTESIAPMRPSITAWRHYWHWPHKNPFQIVQQLLHYCVLHSLCLAMAVSLTPQFMLWTNIPQYEKVHSWLQLKWNLL
jgi:hypothetical protein